MHLAAKLKFDPVKPLYLLKAPADAKAMFTGLTLKASLPAGTTASQVLLFAKDRKTLEEQFHKITPLLSEQAVFWVAYPKKTSEIKSDLLITGNWSVVFDNGYIIASSAAIDETWSGIRIRRKDPNAKYVSSVPMEERNVPGIDYVNRTVKLPKDAIRAMAEFPELEAFFNSMSFTHKREYVEAIEEAKKPETRQRRIDKMIEMVIELRDKKEKKK